MSTSTGSFDPKTDPYSVTYSALTTGQPSIWGGFKRVTINGVPALEYLTTGQMSWGDYYNFMRGLGDFSASRVAEVLEDDKVMAGIRRRYFSTCVQMPQAVGTEKRAIEINVHAVLARAAKPQQAARISAHMVGAPPSTRTRAVQAVAKQNLFQTQAALQDITDIVDAAVEQPTLKKSEELVEEVFSYALPDEEATPDVDEQIQRGMSVLLTKGATAERIYELFQKGYGSGIPEDAKLKRFIPLFLRSLSLVDYPLVPMRDCLTLLRSKSGSIPARISLIERVQQFISVIEGNKKRDEDVCFLVLKPLLDIFGNWPAVDFGLGDWIESQTRLYSGVGMASPQKDSLPGLATFATVVASGLPISDVFSVRPNTFRTGNEQRDFHLFFHHILASAKQSDKPALVLARALPFLESFLSRTEYGPVVDDLKALLPIVMERADLVQKYLIPLLEAIVPKKVLAPAISPSYAQESVLNVFLDVVGHSAEPAATLLAGLSIFKKQIPLPAYQAVMDDISGLLELLKQRPGDARFVQEILLPLLNKMIPRGGQGPAVGVEEASRIVANVIFLENLSPHIEVSELVMIDFSFGCGVIEEAVRRKIENAKMTAISTASRQAQRKGAMSEKMACRGAFLENIGELLDFDGERLNLRLLPMIAEVFLGNKAGQGPSAPMRDEDQHILQIILEVAKTIPDSDYNDRFQRQGVPALIRAWK